LVPTVCRNVSRITRLAGGGGAAGAGAAVPGNAGQVETIMADSLDALTDGAPETLLYGGAHGAAANGTLTFSQVGSAGGGINSLVSGGSPSGAIGGGSFGSPFTGGSGGPGNSGPGAPGGP